MNFGPICAQLLHTLASERQDHNLRQELTMAWPEDHQRGAWVVWCQAPLSLTFGDNLQYRAIQKTNDRTERAEEKPMERQSIHTPSQEMLYKAVLE